MSAKQEKNNAGQGKLEREEAMMADPYKALDKLSDDGPGAPSGRSVEIVTKKSGDPFDPMVWEALKRGAEGKTQPESIAGARDEAETGQETGASSANDASKDKQGESGKVEAETAEKKEGQEKPGAESKQMSALEPAADNQKTLSPEQSKEYLKVAKEMKASLDLLQSSDSRLVGLNFDVKVTSEGILVALSDSDAVSMFRIGSAEPNPALVAFIGKIGQLLEQQKSKVIVRGYTDGRRFLSNKFDNWQLSTARAHMASYMLMRGGLAEKRLRKIEGFGETQLLNPDDPLSGANRRVEMVLVPAS
ncbi:MAG: OmpA family protein [Rhizobiales bacterium]|nr:OmpA family protein [Hyphomicrobiales bacterium]